MESTLKKILTKLKRNSKKGEKVTYSVPDLWNCFDYKEGTSEHEKGILYVNPYKFYASCIENYIFSNFDKDVDYSKSFSIITNNNTDDWDYMGGDWIKRSSIYSMHVRTSTSWDHDGSGSLEDKNINGFKETGTFLKSLAILPLLKKMGIDTIYLLPISKYSTKNKKGELGSPYAVKSFYDLDPNLKDSLLGEDFTIDDEFKAFVEACHILGMRVMIDIIPRTSSRDNDLMIEHPDWFYWIKTADLANYYPPHVPGAAEAEKPSFENINLIYNSQEVWEHIRKFTSSPDKIDEGLWIKLKEQYAKDTSTDFLTLIEQEFGLTTAPAFADCINDPQPPWDDVTFLKLYLDPPSASKWYVKDENQPPYILFDTIKSNLFKGDVPNMELWNMLAGVIPYYQQKFGIDGARIDMGHALPEELVSMLLEKPRAIDKDFSFIAEELLVDGAERARASGYNMIIGYGWWLEPRIFEYKTHEFMYNTINYKAPIFACSETPDTPRTAAREGGRILSKLLTIMNQFLPNAVPFMSSGLEIYETQPMNTGLDARPDERYRLSPEDPYYGKLAFFDRYAFHWANAFRWDMPDTMEAVSKLRQKYIDTITNPNNYIPIHFEHPGIAAIGVGYVMENKRWKDCDNVIIAVGNTDLYNEREHVLYLENLRQFSGNASRKAWLAFSANEPCHDIYDFDDNWNLHLKFKPGEVKILVM
jgi:hypothetical protein